MPHGSLRVGEVEIVALCDAVVEASRTLEESYPPVPPEAWPGLRERYPETVGPRGRWELHVHCYVLRVQGRTILFDTGIGSATAPAFGWAGSPGRLPDELEASGVSRGDVDLVVISHVHDDHLGWTVGDDGEPLFPRAGYLVHEADLEALRSSRDPEDAEIWRRTVEPLEASGVLEANGTPSDLGNGVTLLHAPGHTPGHQILTIDAEDVAAVLSADITNHPAQVEEASWSAETDSDPAVAAETRAAMLERFEAEGRLYVTSHFAQPFGRIERGREGRRFRAP